MNNNTQDFTLVALPIVIAILGILAVALILNLLGAQKRAYDTGAGHPSRVLRHRAARGFATQDFLLVSEIALVQSGPRLRILHHVKFTVVEQAFSIDHFQL